MLMAPWLRPSDATTGYIEAFAPDVPERSFGLIRIVASQADAQLLG